MLASPVSSRSIHRDPFDRMLVAQAMRRAPDARDRSIARHPTVSGTCRRRLSPRLRSMPTFRAARGTRDLLPSETPLWSRLERLADDLASRYGYRRIETPMFEQAAVFERGVGEVTDIVEKELFRIAPRTEESESWALRPEPTAGIVRAYVQHGMQTWPQPVKLAMTGPMFRYDRPQAGRYRQFWQFDIEAIGDPGPAVDAEIIELGARFYADVGADRRRGAAQLDRRPRLPARLRRGADRLLPRARGVVAGRRARPAGPQRPAPARLQGSGHGVAQRRGAAHHRPPVRGLCRPLRRRPRATSTPWACRIASSRGSFAASTTTRGPRSSSTSPVGRASNRRSAAAGGTTGWWSCWAAGRRPGSASASVSIGWSWR